MLRALVISDDGYESPGLWLVANTLINMGFKTIVATTFRPSSAMSHSITFNKELDLIIRGGKDLVTVIVDGKPCDAFYTGLALSDKEPDIVISGINLGENTSIQNSLYSSTVAVALEAGMIGLRSIAISVDTYEAKDLRNEWLRKILTTVVEASTKWIVKYGMPNRVIAFNINVPLIKSYGTIPSVKVTKMAMRRFEQRAEIVSNKAKIVSSEIRIIPGTDSYEVKIQKNISITPLTLCIDGISECKPIDLVSTLNFANYINSSLRKLIK